MTPFLNWGVYLAPPIQIGELIMGSLAGLFLLPAFLSALELGIMILFDISSRMTISVFAVFHAGQVMQSLTQKWQIASMYSGVINLFKMLLLGTMWTVLGSCCLMLVKVLFSAIFSGLILDQQLGSRRRAALVAKVLVVWKVSLWCNFGGFTAVFFSFLDAPMIAICVVSFSAQWRHFLTKRLFSQSFVALMWNFMWRTLLALLKSSSNKKKMLVYKCGMTNFNLVWLVKLSGSGASRRLSLLFNRIVMLRLLQVAKLNIWRCIPNLKFRQLRRCGWTNGVVLLLCFHLNI